MEKKSSTRSTFNSLTFNDGYTEVSPDSLELVSREKVLTWLLEASEIDVWWILRELNKRRIGFQCLDLSVGPPRTTRVSMRKSIVSSNTAPSVTSNFDHLPIVQFVSPLHYVHEEDRKVDLDVIRIGDKTGESVVSFKTMDCSAHAGREYVGKTGSIVFQPGESQKSIVVEVLCSDLWKSTTDFKVLLTDDDLSGATLGQYLYSTRVRLIDDTTFPTDAWQDVNWMAADPDVSRPQLLLSYYRLNWSIPVIRRATIKVFLVDVFHIFAESLELLLNVYLLDFILNAKRPLSEMLFSHNRQRSLLLLAVVRLVMFLSRYWLDYKKLSFGLLGSCLLHFKGGLLRKYFNFRADIRDQLHAGDILMAIERDVENIVMQGYCNCLKLLHFVGMIVSKVAFMIVCPRLVGSTSVNTPTVCCLCGMPAVLLLFLYCRTRTVEKNLHERHKKTCEVADSVTMSTISGDLIFGYGLRNYMYEYFAKQLGGYSVAEKNYKQIELNNSYFASWCTFLTIAVYTYFGGLRVVDGELPVGMFVTNLRIFLSFDDVFKGMYDCLASMQTILPPMLRIAKLLNSPTDLHLRKELQRRTIDMTEGMRNHLLVRAGKGQAVMDELPIKLDLEEFTYENTTIHSSVTFGGSVQVRQGSLVAFIGSHNSGKSTLLNLISGVLLPASAGCNVFVPSHLRCVSVAQTILFLPGTLWDNLTLGIAENHPDRREERVRGICKDVLGLDERVLQYLAENIEHRWYEVFSGAQCRLLMLARALIFNAELTTIHKPFNGLSTVQITTVLDALKGHVEGKGLLQESKALDRRPRTIFFSSNHDTEILEEKSHFIVELDPGGLKQVKGSTNHLPSSRVCL